MGPARFLLHPRPDSVWRKPGGHEAAREGGPGQTKSAVCFPEWSPHLECQSLTSRRMAQRSPQELFHEAAQQVSLVQGWCWRWQRPARQVPSDRCEQSGSAAGQDFQSSYLRFT